MLLGHNVLYEVDTDVSWACEGLGKSRLRDSLLLLVFLILIEHVLHEARIPSWVEGLWVFLERLVNDQDEVQVFANGKQVATGHLVQPDDLEEGARPDPRILEKVLIEIYNKANMLWPGKGLPLLNTMEKCRSPKGTIC
jgi:hypothetical protein